MQPSAALPTNMMRRRSVARLLLAGQKVFRTGILLRRLLTSVSRPKTFTKPANSVMRSVTNPARSKNPLLRLPGDDSLSLRSLCKLRALTAEIPNPSAGYCHKYRNKCQTEASVSDHTWNGPTHPSITNIGRWRKQADVYPESGANCHPGDTEELQGPSHAGSIAYLVAGVNSLVDYASSERPWPPLVIRPRR